MIHSFKTKNDGEIEVDTDKMEAYFKTDDLIANIKKDDLGYWEFVHPMWLTQFRMSMMTKNTPLLERQVWREA